jgi:hypothetical protein
MNGNVSSDVDVLQAISDALNSQQSILLTVASLSALILLYILVRIIATSYRKHKNTQKILTPAHQTVPQGARIFKAFNIAQQKIVFDIIREFKEWEIAAGGIPDTVLEKYSMFFFQRLDWFNISPQSARKIASRIYPLRSGQRIEIEIVETNVLYIFERTALIVNEKALAVQKIISSSIKFYKGLRVYISYVSDNKYISGRSKVLYVKPNGDLVFTYPDNLTVSHERRFTRIPLVSVSGVLISERSQEALEVEIIDLSIEGVKVRSKLSLKRNRVYRLKFEDTSVAPGLTFANLDCIVSQIYIIRENLYEYGMSFMYIDLATAGKLKEYMHLLVRRHE